MGLLSRIGLLVDTWNGPSQMKQFAEGWPSKTSDDIKFYRTPLAQYRYRERGEGPTNQGPTIVFSADPPVTLEAYDELIKLFSTQFRVIVFEMPAMGFSAPARGYTFGFRETCDDVAVFMRQVAGEGAVLAFSCAVGLVAVDIAARWPDLVSKLVLMQTTDVAGFERWKQSRDPKGVLARPILGQLAMRKFASARMPYWFRLSAGREKTHDQLCACTVPAMEHGSGWALASIYQKFLSSDIELAPPSQPVLALWGMADKSHSKDNVEGSKNFTDKVQYVSFDDLGHFSELEDPERVFGLIRDFCFPKKY